MDKSIERGLDHIERICDYLNSLIVSTNQAIDRNDKTLWGEYLHKWRNADWEDVLNAYEHLVDKTGYHPSDEEHRAWEQARWNLGAYSKHVSNAMDIRRGTRNSTRLGTHTQGATWHFLMTLRDVYSKLLKIDIENAPGYGETPQNTLFLHQDTHSH